MHLNISNTLSVLPEIILQKCTHFSDVLSVVVVKNEGQSSTSCRRKDKKLKLSKGHGEVLIYVSFHYSE